jgi:hypothetical protein
LIVREFIALLFEVVKDDDTVCWIGIVVDGVNAANIAEIFCDETF